MGVGRAGMGLSIYLERQCVLLLYVIWEFRMVLVSVLKVKLL